MNGNNEPTQNDAADYDIEGAATNLFDIFMQYSVEREEVLLVSEVGLQAMSNAFGMVPEWERGYVFLNFLANLYDKDFKYDMQQFLNMEPTEEADDTADLRRIHEECFNEDIHGNCLDDTMGEMQ